MKEPVTDLADRLALLAIRHCVALNTIAAAPPPHVLHTFAEEMVAALRTSYPVAAVARVRAVVDPGDMDRADFWGTPLGRLLFLADGYGRETCSQAVAAAVFGCSRQWVSAMVAEEKLAPAAGRGVFVEQVQGVLLARLKRLSLDTSVR